MFARSFRLPLVVVMLVSFAGCDSNPSGPAATGGPPQAPGSSSKVGEKAKMPGNGKKSITGNAPMPPD